MRNGVTVLLLATGCALAGAAEAVPAGPDAHMDAYLATWSQNSRMTEAVVRRLYARRVEYYGRAMSVDAVYRDKLAFTRQWPVRRYQVVPGSVTNDCRPGRLTCHIEALFSWTRQARSGRSQSGTNSVRLGLAWEGGTLKIVRESGEPIGRR